ncbi:type II and III secretion system protein family protein [Sphingomonas sp. Tas61C01]|uniref:type II and III secretion system protein family protein n=1 Tax=Sphingomonas sp. Tas61C01 TaxID=3458297 RepID=UPI00403ECFE4
MRISLSPIGMPLAVALAAAAVVGAGAAPAQSGRSTAARPTASVFQVNTGRGRLITLARPMSDVFVADPGIADVQVRSPTLLYVFGKKAGETTISATAKSGAVVYATTVRVGDNYDSIGSMLKLAMPDAKVVATPMNGLVLLTGTVAGPEDAAEAERLVQAYVGDSAKVLSRLRTATPLQVNLQVRIAEVSRSFVKNIGNNLTSRDTTGGFQFGIQNGNAGTINAASTAGQPTVDVSSSYGLPAGSVKLPFDPYSGKLSNPNAVQNTFKQGAQRTTLGLAGRLLGLDLLGTIDLGETLGQVSTLANPNLTALSGETATFLAGGEVPLVISQGFGTQTVEYKQYGVSLAFTPTVLSDGRISMRVRPEVSQLTAAGSVTLGGTVIPGLSTRRVETTLELGSGQSMMIGGLLSNSHDNSIDKTPGLGDVPVLGALFRSNGWKRNETELVVIITPYLVKPVDNMGDIALPTDGYKAPTDLGRVLLGQVGGGVTGGRRPVPTMATETAPPTIGANAPAAPMPVAEPRKQVADKPKSKKGATPAPGFSN